MATPLDPLEHLERGDKWYLAGGRALMFAPTFPRHLDKFGFWDEVYFADVRLERLFTILILDEEGRPVLLHRDSRRWTPDALTQVHTSQDGLRIREDRIVTGRDTLTSRLTVYNEGRRPRRLSVILWSLQERRAGQAQTASRVRVEDVRRGGDYLSFACVVDYADRPYSDKPAANAGWGERPAPVVQPQTHTLYVALGADRAPLSTTVNAAERADTEPLWEISIVPEKFVDGKLAGDMLPEAAAERDGVVHMALHYELNVGSGAGQTIQLGAAVNLNRDRALLFVQNDLKVDASSASRDAWRGYFNSVPYFACSDPFLQRYYWYRWYGLRLLTVNLTGEDAQAFPYPCVFEGIDGFRSHISYSAQCHMREATWMHRPELAKGCMEGLLASQENSGFIPGHLYLWREGRGFYHADWGAAALNLFHVTGNRDFIEHVYPGLSRYADYFERERDREDMHLYDVLDQGETGQEYSPRYLFADADADDWRHIHLKGVDASVYVYRLERALAEMARVLGKSTEAAVWDKGADQIRDSIRSRMWDPATRFFYDVDPRTGKRSTCRAATGFYPFMCDIATEEHLEAISGALLNPEEFNTPWPGPSLSRRDVMFSAAAEWKGMRMSCPWNGRVWPMISSHLCDALANASRTLDPTLRPAAADFIMRFVRMMFLDGDPTRPNCYEHYHPLTATPSLYRGIDDYQHSWVVDLLMRHLVGIQPGPTDTLVIDPLPFAVESFVMEGIRYHGHTVDVRWESGSGFTVHVDGTLRSETAERERVEVGL